MEYRRITKVTARESKQSSSKKLHSVFTTSTEVKTSKPQHLSALPGEKCWASLVKLFKTLPLLVSIFAFTFLFSAVLNPNLNTAQAEPAEASSSFNVNVEESIFISLNECEADTDTPTPSSSVNLSIIPSRTGTFASACQRVIVNTNNPGYSLLVKASMTDPNSLEPDATTNALIYQNPTTLSTKPTIEPTTSPTTNPTILSNDTWGFGVENLNNFSTTYSLNDSTNLFANMPSTDTEVYSSSWPIERTDFDFYYASKLTLDTAAGTYKTEVTYTAVGEEVPVIPCLSDDIICIEVTESGQIAIRNLWTTPITYSIDGSVPISLTEGVLSNNINVLVGNIIEIKESTDNTTFRTWLSSAGRGLVTRPSVSDTARVSITKMPNMNRFTTDSTGTIAGNNFFRFFAGSNSTSYPTAINSLPAGSFDTSNIITAGIFFFQGFNYSGALTTLPTGSFNTSNIISDGGYFFQGFNCFGALISLPAGSFDTSNITTAGTGFFREFNAFGALISLPAGSFNTSNTTTANGYFFSQFNHSGALTSLPAGSFNTSSITTAGTFFFYYFNHSGALTFLPAGSFNTSNIRTMGADYFFNSFNGDSASNAGKLQVGSDTSANVVITNKSSLAVTFWQRPNGNPDSTATSTSVPALNGTITFLAE